MIRLVTLINFKIEKLHDITDSLEGDIYERPYLEKY